MASQKQTALSRARQRRVVLDRNRAARDNRVEQATARVFVLLEQHAAAEQAMQQANTEAGQALRELLEEGIDLNGVAELCELDVAQVRRLVRSTATAAAETASVARLHPAMPPKPEDLAAGCTPADRE